MSDYERRYEIHRPGRAPVSFYHYAEAMRLFDSLVSSETDTESAQLVETTRIVRASFKKGTDHGTQPTQ